MRFSISPGKDADEARRLTACIVGASNSTGNLAHDAVSAVEMHLLRRGWPVGEALGALPEVQKSLGLGRPSCREALIILQARGYLESRRGPGGGLFVAAPKLEDVVEALLLYLTVNRAGQDCIREFRILVWRMVVDCAIERGLGTPARGAQTDEQGFAVELARRIGNPAMVLAAQIAEMLVGACEGCPAPTHDSLLERALRARDRRMAFSRVENLAVRMDLAAPLLALDAMERTVARCGRKSAMSLAARIARELIHHPEMLEAEWETAERLGYSDAMVRQARRILQDFGVVRCQRGRKGALCEPAVSPAGVIRLLAPCLIASGSSASDNAEVANFLACDAPRIAAGRAADEGAAPTKFQASFASSLELIDMIRIENLLLELAANPLLSIMTRSLGLANLLDPGAKVSLHRRADIVAINHRILRAIEARDAESAGGLARAKGEIQRFEASYRKLA